MLSSLHRYLKGIIFVIGLKGGYMYQMSDQLLKLQILSSQISLL